MIDSSQFEITLVWFQLIPANFVYRNSKYDARLAFEGIEPETRLNAILSRNAPGKLFSDDPELQPFPFWHCEIFHSFNHHFLESESICQ